jgi:hypothetical protein
MDRRLHINTALQIAIDAYPEKSISLDFRAVSVLQSHLMQLHRDQEYRSEGYTREEIEESLLTILQRHSHSDQFKEAVESARNKVLQFVGMDDSLLEKIKNWGALNTSERIETCELTLKHINYVFRNHEHLPPVRQPNVTAVSSNNEKSYVACNFETQSYVPTVWSLPHKLSLEETITVNTHRNSCFSEPDTVLGGLFGEYVSLVQQNLYRINNTFFHTNKDRFLDDVALLETARHEGGYVDMFLDRAHGQQFTTSLINAEKTAFAEQLKEYVLHETDHIPYREPKKDSMLRRITANIGLLTFSR